MTRRLLPILAALVLVSTPATAATPVPIPANSAPPAGTVLVIVAVSDGLTYLPYGRAEVPPMACRP